MENTAPHPIYDRLEQCLADWAVSRADVRAVVIIGSRARAERPADAWSDLDCIVFVDDAAPFTHSADWKVELESALAEPVWFAALDFTGRDDPEWEIVLAGGHKVDLVFTPNRSLKGKEAGLGDMMGYFPYHYVFTHGMRVLVDKGPREPNLTIPAPPEPTLPNQAEFDNCIANCLLELVRGAKLAQRGELWRAAHAINEEEHHNLLTLLEWHAHALHGLSYNTWRYARFLETWADPRAVAALPATYSGSTLAGIGAAVRASLDLLGWLGPETAARLGLVYPQDSVRQTGEWLRFQLP